MFRISLAKIREDSTWPQAWKKYTWQKINEEGASFLLVKSKTEGKNGVKALAHVEVLSTFLPFPSFPQSNKFSQQRGTAPIGPGKEEQEEGARGRAGMRGEKSRREAEGEEGGLKEWLQAPLVQCVSRREEFWLQSLPAPPYGPAGPWPWISPPYLPGSSRNPTYFFLYLCAFLFLHLSHSLFFLCCTLCSCTHSPLNQSAYQFMHMCMPARMHFSSLYLCGSQIRHDHLNCSLDTVWARVLI